jgi:hypothetical protein
MITNQSDEIDNNPSCLNKSFARVGFIPVAALLLIILSTLNLMATSDYTTTALFAQGQCNNTNTSASTTAIGADTTTQGLNSTLADFASNIEQIRGHLNAAVMNKQEESLGGQGVASREPEKIISEIRTLLNQTIQEYKQQNYDKAEALAIRAYLDNFEFIEAPLAEKDSRLMVNTEVMLREHLRYLIQSKVPLEELQQHIDKINNNLDLSGQADF